MSLFESFFLGGFESSTQRRADGVRLDLIASTEHGTRAAEDYALLAAYGIRAVRDAARWHLIENRRGVYDFASLLPQVRAARDAGTQVVWDLFHYGFPNGVDLFGASFVGRFADYARAVARLIASETDTVPWFVAINEISFVAWAAGDVGYLNPFARGRGFAVKTIMVRAAIAATQAIREVIPGARFAVAEPLINVLPETGNPAHLVRAAGHMDSQFEAVDWLMGRTRPELGGDPSFVDAVGLNYYFDNQWVDRGRRVHLGDTQYRPPRELFALAHARCGAPVFIAETGSEGVARAPWLHHIADEVAAAIADGVPVEGVCLYPILSHIGWDNDRHCPNGLFEAFGAGRPRTLYAPLAEELARQQARFAVMPAGQGSGDWNGVLAAEKK